jgi:hypothetical protein
VSIVVCRFSTWEPEENILDPRLIQQFVQKEASKILQAADNSAAKRGRKTKPEMATAKEPAVSGKESGGRKRTKSVSREVKEDDSESSEEEKEEESPKPAFLMQTLSGRNPKPPKRLVWLISMCSGPVYPLCRFEDKTLKKYSLRAFHNISARVPSPRLK